MPDYMFLLESRLSPGQRAAMMRVQELSAAMGFNVYLTGGTVRDLVTGASLRDLDFSVEGNPSKIARELEKGGAKILSEDEKLRQIEILFAGDCDGSISAARDDHYVRPGTRPEVRWSTIMEDLRRRDFSLNSIAISLNPCRLGGQLGQSLHRLARSLRREGLGEVADMHEEHDHGGGRPLSNGEGCRNAQSHQGMGNDLSSPRCTHDVPENRRTTQEHQCPSNRPGYHIGDTFPGKYGSVLTGGRTVIVSLDSAGPSYRD